CSKHTRATPSCITWYVGLYPALRASRSEASLLLLKLPPHEYTHTDTLAAMEKTHRRRRESETERGRAESCGSRHE
ncbi:hypothetical protein TSAR_004880, partial [Trichomalopsis sarcophagae]